MWKKKVISAIAFVAIAMVSGGLVSIYGMNKSSENVKDVAQVEIVDTVQTKNDRTAQAEIKNRVQADKVTFSCGVSGCTLTETHQHGLCGIDGCTQIGEHCHGENSSGYHQSGHHGSGYHQSGHHGSGHHQSGHHGSGHH
ncbi:MAG: hypothetical protein NC307_03130 [Roseburia sp.]|nr:hypothetical protein [Roseburia sp.]